VPRSSPAWIVRMTSNRKLVKTNLRGFRSETTESNERLKIWLAFVGSAISATTALIAVLYNH